MGSLKDVVIKTEEVETTGGSVTVGPLTAKDILALFVSYRGDVESVFKTFTEGGSESDIFLELAVTSSEMVAEIIARANGEPDDAGIAKARSLDFGAQLVALEKIGGLTTASVGGLGNLAALIERLSGSVSKATAQKSSLLASGSTTSGDNVRPSSQQDTPTPGTTPSG